MSIKELDVVKLKDGREGTVIDIGNANGIIYYMVEPDNETDYGKYPTVTINDIEKVIWVA